jgi:serine/threonine protein kinase
MQRGELEYLSEYSRELNSLLRLMVHPDPAARPSAAKLLAHHLLNPTITKSRYTHKSELDAHSVVLMKTDLGIRDGKKCIKKI